MTDNSAPVGSPAGVASAPTDIGDIDSQLGAISDKFEPQIQAEQGVAEGYEKQAVDATTQAADYAESVANDHTEDAQIAHWLTQVPTRQAAYTTNMHAAPVLAILTALGGKVTRLNGQQMLAATSGMVQGLNESSEEKYDAAWKAWNASYQAMRDHQQTLQNAHRLMLQSYAGRADAYQRAAEAARRMTGDLLTAEQRAKTSTIDLFKAQNVAIDKLARLHETQRMNGARIRQMLAQQAKWKQVSENSAKLDPATRAQIKAEEDQWKNYKSQVDEAMRQRGQISANLEMSADAKAQAIEHLDDRTAFLQLQMDSAMERATKLAAGVAAAPPAPKPAAAGAGAAGDRPMAAPVHPAQTAPSGSTDQAPPPEAVAMLQKQPGKPIKFSNGQTWVVDAAGGQPHRVQ